MNLINIDLTSELLANNTIEPNLDKYKTSSLKYVIDNKLIYCDLSGTTITDNSFNLDITLSQDNDYNLQKFDILFKNNLNNPIVVQLKINNIPVDILFNGLELSKPDKQMNKQEFILTYNETKYNVISTIKQYEIK